MKIQRITVIYYRFGILVFSFLKLWLENPEWLLMIELSRYKNGTVEEAEAYEKNEKCKG